jgi:hypothetical protein
MVILKEKSTTFEELIESLRESLIDFIEIYSKSGSYLKASFGRTGKMTILPDGGFHIQNSTDRISLPKKSIRKVERDISGWDVILTTGDNWRIHN